MTADPMVTSGQLARMMPRASREVIRAWHAALLPEMRAAEIVTDARQAAFLASVANETGGLTRFDEMTYFNTSWSRIAEVFGGIRGLTGDLVWAWKALGQKGFDEAFFNYVYDDANRAAKFRLGNIHPGDGYRYRGMGPNQLTGLGNYMWMARETGLPLVEDPEMIKLPAVGAKISAHFWRKSGCNAMVDDGSQAGFLRAMRRLNAGLQDFSHHLGYWAVTKAILANDTIGDIPEPLPAGKLHADVRAIQSALVARGYNTGGVDGIAGPKTRAAIAAFEAASGLPSDGIVDDVMLRALGVA